MKARGNGKRPQVQPSELERQDTSCVEEVPPSPALALNNHFNRTTGPQHADRAAGLVSQVLLETLSADGGLAGVLDQLVIDISEHFAASMVYLGVHCKEESVLFLEAFHVTRKLAHATKEWRPFWPRRTTPTALVWRELLRTRRPLVISNAASDPRAPFLDLLLAESPGKLLVIPVLEGGELLGLLGVTDPAPSPGAAENITLPEELAQRTVLAAKLARLANSARYSAVLGERSRMAGDLHDIMARGFTGIIVQLGLAEQILTSNRQEARRHIVRARRFAIDTLAEARSAVFAMQLQKPGEQHLAQSLQKVTSEISADTRIQAQFLLHGKEPFLSAETETQLLAITQEAVTNILRHARSSKMWIKLLCSSRHVRLVVEDDGRGFILASAGGGRGMGLKNMEKRAWVAGGHLAISTRPGSGTEVRVTIPCGTARPLGKSVKAEMSFRAQRNLVESA
jgi:signal transduction histidine kinase